MKIFVPQFYNDFHCLASACPDSCCKEWEVDIDSATAALYEQLTGPLGQSLREVLRKTEDGVSMIIQDGRCPMWRQDGLCQIHAQLGHDALSKTCREYPRICHDFGDFQEFGLELSCPEAARLIFSGDYTMEQTDDGTDEEVFYEQDVMDTLLRSRRDALAFLENSSLPLPQRLAILLLFAHDVQSEIDGGEPAVLRPGENLEDARKYAASGNFSLIRDFFLKLEILTDRWQTLLYSAKRPHRWDPRLAKLARYGIYRYWLQAISDYDLVCRVKLVIIACLLVSSLNVDPVAAAQLFSKEIENDPDNVEAILDGAYTSPSFTDIQLLGLLLNP